MYSLYFDIVILVISHFGFEGGTLVLIVSVPGHCLSFTFYLLASKRYDDSLPVPLTSKLR